VVDIFEIGVEVSQSAGGVAEQIAVGIACPQSSARQKIDVELCRLRFGRALQIRDQIVPVEPRDIGLDTIDDGSDLPVVTKLEPFQHALIAEVMGENRCRMGRIRWNRGWRIRQPVAEITTTLVDLANPGMRPDIESAPIIVCGGLRFVGMEREEALSGALGFHSFQLIADTKRESVADLHEVAGNTLRHAVLIGTRPRPSWRLASDLFCIEEEPETLGDEAHIGAECPLEPRTDRRPIGREVLAVFIPLLVLVEKAEAGLDVGMAERPHRPSHRTARCRRPSRPGRARSEKIGGRAYLSSRRFSSFQLKKEKIMLDAEQQAAELPVPADPPAARLEPPPNPRSSDEAKKPLLSTSP
jgi:hypothetical protein